MEPGNEIGRAQTNVLGFEGEVDLDLRPRSLSRRVLSNERHVAGAIALALMGIMAVWTVVVAANASGRSHFVVNVYADEDLAAAITRASPGDVILVHAGMYTHIRLSSQFASRVTVKAAPGETVTLRGIELNSASFLTFKGFTIDSGSSSVDNLLINGATHDIVIAGNRIHGGRFGIYVGGPAHSWPYNVDVRGNEIFNAYNDDVRVNGVKNMTIADNFVHDPQVNGQHNDGFQVIAADKMVLTRNHITFVGYNHTGGPNQGIILGRADPYDASRYVRNITVSANLIDHWEGTPIILAGTSNVKVVNNTAYDSGSHPAWTAFVMTAKNKPAQFDNTGVEVWNNIFNRMTISNGSGWPSYCGYNLLWPGGGDTCGTSLITSNPQFVDHVAYKLRASSPALSTGVNRQGTPRLDVGGLGYSSHHPARGARSRLRRHPWRGSMRDKRERVNRRTRDTSSIRLRSPEVEQRGTRRSCGLRRAQGRRAGAPPAARGGTPGRVSS